MPHEELIICGHGTILQKEQTLGARKDVDIRKIANPSVGVAGFQVAVELRVAPARVVAAIAKGAVDTQDTAWAQNSTNSAEEILHGIPRHDVECVRREHGIDRVDFPWQLAHVELDGGAQIGGALARDALMQPRQVFAPVAGLP